MTEHRIAYILLVHRDPAQVARLVRRLDAAGARFLIHVDRSSDIDASLRRALPLPNVEFLPRRRTHWASFGLTEAALDGVRVALRSDFDHAVVLSGQDYPIKPPEEIASTLRRLGDRSLLDYERFPRQAWGEDGGFDRVARRHVWTATRFAWSLPRLRKLPCGMWPYGGSGWWAMSRVAAEHVVDTVDRLPALVRYFRRTRVSDEIFFQTILLNSPLADTVVNAPVTFADWSDRGERTPAVLRPSDLGRLREEPHLFARKFDEQRFHGTLDLIDHELLGGPAPAPEALTLPVR